MTRAWWQFGRREDELSEELESHIAMAVAERVARGESLDSATAAARRQFGNREVVRGTARDVWGWTWLESLMLDFRYALRKLREAPGFTVVATLSLAIGIGATVTMYSVVDAADIRGLPYPEANRLYVLQQTAMIRTRADGPLVTNASPAPAATTAVWLATAHAFDATARVGREQLLWPHDDESEPLDVASVGSGFFGMLGAKPVLGRAIAPGDTTADAPGVIVLSHTFWHDRFGADRNVVGQRIQLDTSDAPNMPHETYTVIGVMPEQVDYPPAVTGWTAERAGSIGWATVLAHLADGKTAAAAIAELQAATRALPPPQGSTQPPGVRATGLRESLVTGGPTGMFSIDSAEGRAVRFGIVFFVLIIAMFNVGNLLLARSAARDQEMSVRRALGASRARLAQQLLVEGGCIALIGGSLGIALARWGIVTSAAFGSLAIRGIVPVLDWRVLAFSLALTVIVALGTGFIPVIALGRNAAGSEGGESPKASAGRARTRVQGGLLVMQVAAALTLMTGAGILGKELLRLQKQGFGIDATNITFFQNIHRPFGRSTMSGAEFRDEVVRQLQRIPGVSSVSVMEFFGNDAFYPVGQPAKAGRTIFDHQDIAVNRGFLRTIGVPLLRGRDLTDADYASAAPVALVSSATAESFWPGEDPLGKQVVVPPARRWGDTTKVEPLTVTIVGVVGNLRLGRVLGPPPMSLLRPNGAKAGIANYYVRTTKDPELTLPAVRRELHTLQQIPLSRMMFGNLQEIGVNRQLSEQSVTTRALIAFAAIALLLAILGIHGLVAYAVAQRTREIGVRMALGAESKSVLLLVTQRGLRLAAIGIGFGVVGAFALSQAIRSMLYGTSPTDPTVFIGSAVLLAAVVGTASYLPARRATRVDPMIALRVD
jgi:predicted permease